MNALAVLDPDDGRELLLFAAELVCGICQGGCADYETDPVWEREHFVHARKFGNDDKRVCRATGIYEYLRRRAS